MEIWWLDAPLLSKNSFRPKLQYFYPNKCRFLPEFLWIVLRSPSNSHYLLFSLEDSPTCVWHPSCMAFPLEEILCMIEVSCSAQLAVSRVVSRVWRSDFLYSFVLFPTKLSSAFYHGYGGRQAVREAFSSKANVPASAFAVEAVAVLWAWSVLAQRMGTSCEAAWHCHVWCSLDFSLVAAGVWPWVTFVSEPRGQHIQQSLCFVQLCNTSPAHVCPGLQCLWLLPGLQHPISTDLWSQVLWCRSALSLTH